MKHLTNVFVIVALAFGLTAATIHDAEAGRRHHRHHHNGGLIAGAIIGGLALGALANSHRYRGDYDDCYRGPRRCAREYRCFIDSYGDERCRTVRRCYRPVYCD